MAPHLIATFPVSATGTCLATTFIYILAKFTCHLKFKKYLWAPGTTENWQAFLWTSGHQVAGNDPWQPLVDSRHLSSTMHHQAVESRHHQTSLLGTRHHQALPAISRPGNTGHYNYIAFHDSPLHPQEGKNTISKQSSSMSSSRKLCYVYMFI